MAHSVKQVRSSSRTEFLLPAVQQLRTQNGRSPGRLYLHCSAGNGRNARLFFSVPKRVSFGQTVGLVGSHEATGNWNPEKGLTLTWHENDTWSAEVELPAGMRIEYKFYIQNASGQVEQWQPGNNLLLDVPNAANTLLVVTDDWEGKDRAVSIQAEKAAATESLSTQPVIPDAPESFPDSVLEPVESAPINSLTFQAEDTQDATPEAESSSTATEIGASPQTASKEHTNGAVSAAAFKATTAADQCDDSASSSLEATAEDAREVSEQAAEEVAALADAMSEGLGLGLELEVPSEDELQALTTKELKQMLKDRGQKQTGRKAELVERLMASWR